MKSIAKNQEGFMKIRHSVFTERAVRKRKLTAGDLVLIENLGRNNNRKEITEIPTAPKWNQGGRKTVWVRCWQVARPHIISDLKQDLQLSKYGP